MVHDVMVHDVMIYDVMMIHDVTISVDIDDIMLTVKYYCSAICNVLYINSLPILLVDLMNTSTCM